MSAINIEWAGSKPEQKVDDLFHDGAFYDAMLKIKEKMLSAEFHNLWNMSMNFMPHDGITVSVKAGKLLQAANNVKWSQKPGDPRGAALNTAAAAMLFLAKLHGKRPKNGEIDLDTITDWVRQETERAISYYPWWPTDLVHQVSIVVEEAQELLECCQEQERFRLSDGADRMRKEAIQTAAMSIRFLMNL